MVTREEIIVGDVGGAAALGGPFVVIDKHQIDVAAVIQLLAPELAKRQDDAARRFARRGHGLAKTPAGQAQTCRQGNFEGGVGDARNIARNLLQGAITNNVVGADTQHLFLAKLAKCSQDGGVLERRIDFFLKVGEHFRPAWAGTQGNAQHIEIIRVGDQ